MGGPGPTLDRSRDPVWRAAAGDSRVGGHGCEISMYVSTGVKTTKNNGLGTNTWE